MGRFLRLSQSRRDMLYLRKMSGPTASKTLLLFKRPFQTKQAWPDSIWTPDTTKQTIGYLTRLTAENLLRWRSRAWMISSRTRINLFMSLKWTSKEQRWRLLKAWPIPSKDTVI